MNFEQFFTEHRNSPSTTSLPTEVRQVANLGLSMFPVPFIAKLAGNPELMIGEATNEILRLEELAVEYPSCGWRIAIGPSSLCVLQLVGQVGKNSFAALSQDMEACLTLQFHRGDNAWVFFRQPVGLVLRTSAKILAPGVRVLIEGDSCPLPPASERASATSWAEIEAVPYWLRELAFETPDSPQAEAAPVHSSSTYSRFCRSRVAPWPGFKPSHGLMTKYSGKPYKGHKTCTKALQGKRLSTSWRK